MLYVQNPRTYSNDLLQRLGVWSSKDYANALSDLGVEEDIVSQLTEKFNTRLEDTHNYCKKIIEFDLNDTMRQKGGSKTYKKRARYSSFKVPSDELLDESKYKLWKGDSEVEYHRIAKECADPALYNINGERLPGNLIEECIKSKTARTAERRNLHRRVLDAAIQCKKAGVSEADLQTCIETKVSESDLVFDLSQKILQNLELSIKDYENENRSFGPNMENEIEELEEGDNSWTTWALQNLKSGSIWTFEKLFKKGYDFTTFVIRDPHTAKIIIFIIRSFISRICKYVYKDWLGVSRSIAKKSTFIDQAKAKIADYTGVDMETGIAKFAIEETLEKFLTGDGFDSMWNTISTVTYETFMGSVSSISVIGGALKGMASAVNILTKETVKFALEISIYQRNLGRAWSYTIDILFMVLPFEIKLDESKNEWVFVWLQGGQCQGFQIQRINERQYPRQSRYSPVRVENKQNLESLRRVVQERDAEDRKNVYDAATSNQLRSSFLPPFYS